MDNASEILARLAALSLEPAQMSEVLRIISDIQAVEDARKAKQRERTARHREKNVTVTLQERDGNVAKVPPCPPKENTQTPLNPPPISFSSSSPSNSSPLKVSVSKTSHPIDEKKEFETQFWPLYPNKVGRGAALRAFATARRKVELGAMLEGLGRYIASKPGDRPWCNPATWLNQERWADQPAPLLAFVNGAPASKIVSAAPLTPEAERRKWDSMLRLCRSNSWEHGWGPAPGWRGCIIPLEFCEEWFQKNPQVGNDNWHEDVLFALSTGRYATLRGYEAADPSNGQGGVSH